MSALGCLYPIKRNGSFYLFYDKPAVFFETSNLAFTEITALLDGNHSVASAKILNYLSNIEKSIGATGETTAYKKKIFRLRLELVNYCNNNCAYCHVFKIAKKRSKNSYMLFGKAYKYIKEYFDVVIKFSKDATFLVNFYGGEALLKWDIIQNLIENFGCDYQGKTIQWTINTNGRLLNDDILSFLKEYNVELHIGCDGPKNINDKIRRSNENRGTYDEIQNAFNLANKHNVYKQIDTVISNVNVDKLEQLIDLASDNKINFIYLDLLYKPGKLLDIRRMVSAYRNAVKYGLSRNVTIGGCCTNISNRIRHKNYSYLFDKYVFLKSVTISTDGEIFPAFSRLAPVSCDSLQQYFHKDSMIWYNDFQKTKEYIDTVCCKCFLRKYCCLSGVIQYQYHTKCELGFEDSCNFLREYILAEFVDEAK